MADIIIIGAGAAGLMAARELSRNGRQVVLIESKDRTGGRISSIREKGFSRPVEAGAEFIHGKLPLTMQLMEEANIRYNTAAGEVWKLRNGRLEKLEDFIENGDILAEKLGELEEDMPVKEFLDRYFSAPEHASLRDDVTRFVEGYDAADVSRASTLALAAEFVEDEEQYRARGGYGGLIAHLEQECRERGCELMLGTAVRELQWSRGKVVVIRSDGSSLEAAQVVVTVPLGVLTAGEENGIRFAPELPDKMKAAQEIGFGSVVKFLLEFKRPFWARPVDGKDLSRMGFMLSDAPVPTWWTQLPEQSGLLTGWLAGPAAARLCYACEEELLKNALRSLASIFSMSENEVKEQLLDWHIANWANDPYSLGAYSYATPGGEAARKLLATPIENTVFFAGEGTYIGPHTGTVEAALFSGLTVARAVQQSEPLKTAQYD